ALTFSLYSPSRPTLHAFPTRRSSDLPPVSFVRDVLPALSKAGCNAGACHAKAEGQNGFKLSVFSYDPRSDYAHIVKDARGRRVRSEEHTSELQSHLNLVCRLLLEKKT